MKRPRKSVRISGLGSHGSLRARPPASSQADHARDRLVFAGKYKILHDHEAESHVALVLFGVFTRRSIFSFSLPWMTERGSEH